MNNPQDFGMLIPLAVAAVVFIVILTTASSRQAQRQTSLRAVAGRWSGMFHDGGWFGYSHAELQIGGTFARLQYDKHGKRKYTHLTIHFPDGKLRMEIYPQTIMQEMRKLLGVQDIEVGNPRFDAMFIIQGNDVGQIREYLTAEAQLALQSLASLTMFTDLHLTVGGGTLRVTKKSEIVSEAQLMQFVAAFEMLFHALLNARNLGIEYLPNSAPNRINESHCQVCGENLQGAIVYCTSCQTPHHLDCWQYVGACSVYACGQKRYRKSSPSR